MKKFTLLATLMIMLALVGCSEQHSHTDVGYEAVEGVTALELAIDEFNTIFAEFDNLEIEETATSSITDNGNHIVVEFFYSSNNGDGAYGFEYIKDDAGFFSLANHGEDISVYSVTK